MKSTQMMTRTIKEGSTSNEHERIFFRLMRNDSLVESCLQVACSIGAPDWWLVGSVIRNPVWDFLHGNIGKTYPRDVDVFYFDSTGRKEETTYRRAFAEKLAVPWDIKNQYLMVEKITGYRYVSTMDAIERAPDTIGAIGVRTNLHNDLEVFCPFGLDDLFAMVVRRNPRYHHLAGRLYERNIKYDLSTVWPRASIIP